MQGLDYLQQPQVQSRIEQVKKAQDGASQMKAILALFSEIRKASKSIVDEIEGGITVSNLDEVTTALHNELTNNFRSLVSALLLLKNSQKKSLEDLKATSEATTKAIEQGFISIKPLNSVEVSNLSEIALPEELKVNNLQELEPYFKTLESAIKGIVLSLPEPQITVNPPDIRVDAPQVHLNTPEIDLDPILQSLNEGLKKLRQNNKSNPVFVRITDLQSVLDKLDEVREASRNVMLGFPGLIGLRGIGGGIADPNTFGGANSLIAGSLGDGSKNVATAGSRVQLVSTSTPCKWIVITAKVANTGTIYIGGNTVSSGRGKPLVNLQETTVNVNDVSQIWMDSDNNGDGVTFYYGS